MAELIFTLWLLVFGVREAAELADGRLITRITQRRTSSSRPGPDAPVNVPLRRQGHKKRCPTAALLWLRLAGGFVCRPGRSRIAAAWRRETSPSLRTFANIREHSRKRALPRGYARAARP